MSGRQVRHAILAVMILIAPGVSLPQAKKGGSPERNLPSNITQLTGFGERASWSPDGNRIAFMGKSFGDAFEIDLKSRLTRLLTGHFLHKGFLRVQYLANGDSFLIGARTFEDVRTTRARDEEMWVMKADAKTPPVPLNQRISEGVAISRTRMKIAWANGHRQYPGQFKEKESALYTADIEYKDGVPTLVNKKEVLRSPGPGCYLEAQDFRNDDTELIYSCYREHPKGIKADVMGVNLKTGNVIAYRKIDGEYNEPEGISPDGQWTLVESSRDQGLDRQTDRFIDIWKLKLDPGSNDFVRLTRWGDSEGYKASNPVVSPDGKWIAFQSARNDEPAGVGHGIFLLKLQ